MAYNEKALAVINQRRAELEKLLADTDIGMIAAWVSAWDELSYQFEAALADLYMQATNGRLTGTVVGRNLRLREALSQAAVKLDELANDARVSAASAAEQAALNALQTQFEAVMAQMPDDQVSGLTRNWTRVNADALAAIVKRTSERIHSQFYPLSSEAVKAMKGSLVRGIAVGDNPRAVAKDMLRRAEMNFNGGLNRAMVIARTEILDAHRGAGKAAEQGNADVLKGWMWLATLDTKTCPSCLGMHGTEHPLEDDGPIDHHQGRCDRLPLTKSWRELGFNIDEPPSIIPSGEDWFNSLTPDAQLRMMGPTRLELLRSGAISFQDLSTVRKTDGWRDSRHVTPVRDLLKAGG